MVTHLFNWLVRHKIVKDGNGWQYKLTKQIQTTPRKRQTSAVSYFNILKYKFMYFIASSRVSMMCNTEEILLLVCVLKFDILRMKWWFILNSYHRWFSVNISIKYFI